MRRTSMHRSILLHGLSRVLRSPGALLWTYGFNLAFALVAGIAVRSRFSDVLSHSLAAERLTSAFDLGVLGSAFGRVNRDAPSSGSAALVAPVCYLLVYLTLVPGALTSFRGGTSSRLASLLANGVRFLGRFLLIALLTAAVCGLVLGALFAAQTAWSSHVQETTVGNAVYWLTVPTLGLILLVGSVLRLYFDLVQVYTVALAEQTRPDGTPDRRFYRVLLPALRTLGKHFIRATTVFVLLSGLGLAAMAFTGVLAIHTLAQPRTWPMFLLAQAGLFLMLLTRFWQRGAETVLAEDNPLALPVQHDVVVPPYATPPPPRVNGTPALSEL